MTAIALSPRAQVRSTRSISRAIARRLPVVSRSLLGLVFLFAGLNGFLNFMPQPTSLPKGAAAFALALFQSGYMMQLVAGTQLLSGALLLVNRYVPLALALLAPVIVNIVAFHAFLLPSGLIMAAIVFALELHLAITYRAAYRSMLVARVSPAAR
ncbi:MAG TPA: hypothetical protein VJO52_12035 [Gemmatimonadaceae bacterium]|nr:hypothetical protein [Gemmatimonadaceae bacterium]